MMKINISARLIGPDHPPFIIIETSDNYNQSLERALETVEAAAKAGAYAIKMRTYIADTITLYVCGGSFEINDPDLIWAGKNLQDVYKQSYTPWEWNVSIVERASELGLICFRSPLDEPAVGF